MPPGTQFQLMGSWYTNAHCPYDLVLAVAMLRIFGSEDERSGLAGVCTFKSSDRYFGYAVVNAVWHRESIKWLSDLYYKNRETIAKHANTD